MSARNRSKDRAVKFDHSSSNKRVFPFNFQLFNKEATGKLKNYCEKRGRRAQKTGCVAHESEWAETTRRESEINAARWRAVYVCIYVQEERKERERKRIRYWGEIERTTSTAISASKAAFLRSLSLVAFVYGNRGKISRWMQIFYPFQTFRL